jgi:DNA-binding FadR family transcriptional regulator
MRLTEVKTQRAFEAISSQITERIRRGELRAGDRLPNERELADAFAVSRHAVREALRSMESVGLLHLRKGATGGAFVSGGRPEAVAEAMRGMFYVGGISLAELTEARLEIETAVLRLVCDRLDEAGLALLEENVAAAERATEAGDNAAKVTLNIRFHELLATLTGNTVLVVMMKALLDILREFAQRVGPVTGLDVIASRRRLLRHLRAGRRDSAVAELVRCLRAVHRHYLSALKGRGAAEAAGTKGR